MQLTLKEWYNKLSGHVTLFLTRHLTIIYFDLNIFLQHFSLLCTGVDLCLILRFLQRVKILLILMFTKMATRTRKRAHFKYVIKSKLFFTRETITRSVSICLMTYSRCRQLCHTPSICHDMTRNYSGKCFTCPPGLLLKFFHIWRPMVFKMPLSKKVKNQASFTPFRNKKSKPCISVLIFKKIWQPLKFLKLFCSCGKQMIQMH